MKKIILKRPLILKNVNLNNFTQKEFFEFFQKNKNNKKYFKYLGRGQDREVFMFYFNNEKYIVKSILRNRQSGQNKNEISFYKKAKENNLEYLLSKVLLNFSNEKYIIMEYSDNIKYVNYFEKIYHLNKNYKDILNTYNFKGRVPFNNIYYACYYTKTNFKKYIEELNKLQSIGLDLEDLYLDNLGIKNKKLIIRDFGFSIQEEL